MGHRQLHNQKQYVIPDSISEVHFCLTQKNIYFLRMGGWPSLKTEHRRQKWTSDMESGIIYCLTSETEMDIRYGVRYHLLLNIRDRNGHQIWSPVSSTAFGDVVVCAPKEFGWIICSRSIYFILGQPLFNVFLVVSHKKIYIFSGWAVGLAGKRNVGDRNGLQIWSPVSLLLL